MARKTKGYVNRESRDGYIYVHIKDRKICDALREYGKKMDINMEILVRNILIADKSIYTLLDEADRLQYELLDEDEKIDVILEMKKKISELEAQNVPRGTIEGGTEDA